MKESFLMRGKGVWENTEHLHLSYCDKHTKKLAYLLNILYTQSPEYHALEAISVEIFKV